MKLEKEVFGEGIFARCPERVIKKYLSFPSLKREYQATIEGEIAYCALDFETTGFEPEADAITEVGAVKVVGGEITNRLTSLIDPEIPIPFHVRRVTGIDDEMVRGSPTIGSFFPELKAFIADLPVVAHSRLEERFLSDLYVRFEGKKFENPYIDTFDLAIFLMPSLKSHRQADLARIWGLYIQREHRASYDVEILAEIFEILLNALYNAPLALIKALKDLSQPSGSGLSYLLNRVLLERSGGRPVEKLKIEDLIEPDYEWIDAPPLKPKEGYHNIEEEKVQRFFSTGGPLAALFDSYEERREQLEMALAVRDAFLYDEVLLVEAGTGTGKSLAYLVPSALWALSSSSTVVVSTRTLNLQDQLYTKDLPQISLALANPDFRYSVLKGFSNYVCARKLQEIINGGATFRNDQLAVLGMLITWLGEGGSGDYSMLNVSDLKGLDFHVLADHRDCAADECLFARNGCCTFRRAISRACRSHIVVVNHSLLLSGANIDFERVVIDEAHTLEEVATECFTSCVSYIETKRFLNYLYNPFEASGFVVDIRKRVEPNLSAGSRKRLNAVLERMRAAIEGSRVSLERFFLALADFHGGDERDTQEIRFRKSILETQEYSRLLEEGANLAAALDEISFACVDLESLLCLENDEISNFEYILKDLRGKVTRLLEIKSKLELFLCTEENEDQVKWAVVSHPDDLDRESIKCSPVSVGENLKLLLYDQLDSLVMTSATLTVKGSFQFFKSRCGVDLIESGRRRELILESSFDFKEQMQILTVHDMPEPDSPEYEPMLAGVIKGILKASMGGGLVLFTNRRLMIETFQKVAEELEREGLSVLCQLPGHSRRRLAEEFVGDLNTSLFGTASFWEGVDASGETLRIVILTRIPFESPGRAVFEARCERLRKKGKSDFMELSLPVAALRLKQGVGRLIRTRKDRGQVVILDSRMSSKRYGRILEQTLPGGTIRKVSLDEVERMVSEFQRRS